MLALGPTDARMPSARALTGRPIASESCCRRLVASRLRSPPERRTSSPGCAYLAGLARGEGFAQVLHRAQEAPGVVRGTRPEACVRLEPAPDWNPFRPLFRV
jgi:hypothetical protein